MIINVKCTESKPICCYRRLLLDSSQHKIEHQLLNVVHEGDESVADGASNVQLVIGSGIACPVWF